MKYQRFFGILFFILCFAYAFNSGVLKTDGAKHIDGRYIYIAGTCWLTGQSPYNFDTFSRVWQKEMKNEKEVWQQQLKQGRGAFVYPPTMGVIAIPIALFSWDIAKYVLDFMNLLFLLLIAFFSGGIIKKTLNLTSYDGKIWAGMGLACLISAVQWTIFIGQTPLIALAGCLGAIYFFQRSNIIIASLFIVVASIKPQLSLLPVIYLFIMARNWSFFGWSSVFVAVTTMSILVLGGDYNPFSIIQGSTTTHLSLTQFEASRLSGLFWFMDQIGINHPVTFISPVAGLMLVSALVFWLRKKDLGVFDNFGNGEDKSKMQTLLFLTLPFCMTPIFMPLHGYDYVVFFLVFSSLIVMRGYFIALLLPGIILVARPSNVANLINFMIDGHVTNFYVSRMLESIGAIYLTITIVIMAIFVIDVQINHSTKD